jgi:OOP family OmpA-OmpF porin
MKPSVVVLAFAASAFSLPAAAQVNWSALYLGAGVGQSKAKDWCSGAGSGVSCDDKDTAWKIFGGYQFNRNFAAELGYAELGNFRASVGPFTDEAKVRAWELSAIGAWPLMERFSVFGRLGVYRANVEESINVPGASAEHDNNDLTYGLGLQYDITKNLGIRGEWQRYQKVGGGDVAMGAGPGDKSNLDVLGISALWRFQ